MKPYQASSILAVRDSLEEEFSDDVEDDVFIRDGKSSKNYEENGLKRPLMAPRRKKHRPVTNNIAAKIRKRAKCWKCCEPFCYGLIALTILFAVILFAAIILTMFPVPLQKIKIWLNNKSSATAVNTISDYAMFYGEVIPCTQISVRKTWSKVFSQLNSESPVRKTDVNGDSIDDIIFGYGVDDSFQYDDRNIPKCSGAVCEGGILALDGVTGNTIWQTWTAFNVFSMFCTQDFNGDERADCIAAGRGGLVVAVNGRNGEIIWTLAEKLEGDADGSVIIDLYTVNSVRDVNDDGTADIVAVHVEERESSRSGHIKLISGKDGKLIRSISTPFREEVFVPIQVLTQPDGSECILVLTGGQNSPGGVYLLRLSSIMQYTNEADFGTIYRNPTSGFMVPAVLSDINGDQIEDIIVASFNSTVYAFDGNTFETLWSHTFSASETVSAVVPGHFNNDNVTDFMIKYNSGPGFPIYYYSQTTILNGLNGDSLLENMIRDSGGPYSLLGGVSVSQTFGGDFFLHWQTHCKGNLDAANDVYQFIPDSDIIQQARADTCMLRYNTSTILKLNAISRHIEPPGAVIFSTDDLVLQLNQSEMKKLDTVSPIKHPKMLKKLMNKESIVENANTSPAPKIAVTADDSLLLEQQEQQQKQLRLQEQEQKQNQLLLQQQELLLQQQRQQQLQQQHQQEHLQMPIRRPAFGENEISKKASSNPAIEFARNQEKLFEMENDRKHIKNYFQMDPNVGEKLFELDQEQPPNDEYDSYINYEPVERKIPMRSKYPINRDVRSKTDIKDFDEMLETDPGNITDAQTVYGIESARRKFSISGKDINHAETLWDLEIEKEMAESQGATDFDYSSKANRQAEMQNKFLPSISSTGVLLKSMDNTPSSIDFVFVLNVRESETYPPLLLPQDLSCVEDKLSAYRSFTTEDLLALEKKFLAACLHTRLSSSPPPKPMQLESQFVVTRLSITCNCSDLKDGEICAKLNNIENQSWTGFMGNDRNGLYY